MKNVWGWESPQDRLKRHAGISSKRRMEALEGMRQFLLKVRRSSRPLVERAREA
jgi:hypothetical protein